LLGAGGASLRAGELELMVHRRTLVDDRRGVAEALNETACGCSACACPGLVARGVHWVALAPAGAPAAAAGRRALQQLLNDPPVLAFGGRASVQGQRLRRAWSLTGGRALQGAAHLLTLVRTEPRRLLLRLAHLLEAEELPDAAAAAAPAVEILDLGPLLRGLGCGDAPALEELSLSGNQRRGDAEVARRRFRGGEARRGADGGGGGAQVAPRAGTVSAAVELRPMEVRTFESEC
jgi:alpha-mannosidase